MDAHAALDELPGRYAIALRLEASGASGELIAQAVCIPVQEVPQFLGLARRKLRRLAASEVIQ